MKTIAILAFVCVACASLPVDRDDHRLVLEGQPVDRTRDVAVAVVEDIAHPSSVVRITDRGSVLTEGRIGVCGKQVACNALTAYPGSVNSPWTTIEVRVQDLGASAAVEVAIEYESCEPAVDCNPERYASTGELERRILDGIRTRMEGEGGPVSG